MSTGDTQGTTITELGSLIDMHAHPPQGADRVQRMLAAARQVGIERLILCSVGPSNAPHYPSLAEVRRANEHVAKLIEEHPGFVFGLAYVNPNHADAIDLLERRLRQPGFLGIKLWISCRDERGRLDPVYPVLEFASQRQVPVLCHAFYRAGGNLPGELSPADVARLAARYPKARLVMAHLGGQWSRGIRSIGSYPNVWTDFSGSRAYMGSVEFAVSELGDRRVLYGSDAYFRSFAAMSSKVAAARLELSQKRRIVWENSAALFFREGEPLCS